MTDITLQPIYILLKDILTVIFTVTGLIIAGLGLKTWKKQIWGTKHFEAAYNLHYSILRVREAIKYVRNPAIWPSEQNKALKTFSERHPEKSSEQLKNEINAYVYEIRWEKITQALTETESHLLAVETLWGNEINTLVRPLNKKITDLNIALRQFFNPELRTTKWKQMDKIIYDISQENEADEFSKQINTIVDSLKNYLEGKIK